jgi:hypothetical protein
VIRSAGLYKRHAHAGGGQAAGDDAPGRPGAEQTSVAATCSVPCNMIRNGESCGSPISGAGLRILMVSIVDPAGSLNGAGTVTRGLLRVFEAPDLRATVESLAIPPPSYHYHSLRQMGSIARSFKTAALNILNFAREG